MVEHLINHDQGAWKEDLVRSLFVNEDAQQILSIPLPISNVPDELSWHSTNSAKYKVSSGYKVAVDLKENGLPKYKGENNFSGVSYEASHWKKSVEAYYSREDSSFFCGKVYRKLSPLKMSCTKERLLINLCAQFVFRTCRWLDRFGIFLL